MYKSIFLISFILVFLSTNSHALNKISSFKSTRLIQTGGTGVASLLMNEATLLNPASATFFTQSTLSYQRDSIELNEKSSERSGSFKNGLNEFYNITDTANSTKGAFSYLHQNERAGRRKRLALSSSFPISKKSSAGIIYKYTDEKSDIRDEVYHEFTVGFFHIQTSNLSFGFIYDDPQIKISEYSKYSFGTQYALNKYITLMLDAGSGDVKNPSRKSFTKYAIQLAASERLFFRYGKFNSKFDNNDGIGYGLSWVGPKFSIDIAREESSPLEEKESFLNDGEKLVNTSFSLSALF